MSIQIPARVTSFMRVEFTTADHPEFDRAITLPQSAPMEWIVDAYLLSIGLEPRERADFDDEPDDWYDRPRGRTGAGEWGAAIPDLDHRPDVIVRTAEAPPVGAALVSVTSLSSTVAGAPRGGWLTAAPPFREDDVNRELVRRHGVVTPFFEDHDMRGLDPRIRRSSRVATLLSALTPARRLALLAHIDSIGLLHEKTADRGAIDAAVAPVARLLQQLGGAGVAQDASTGWIPDPDVERLARSLGWDDDSDETRRRGRALVDFARRAKLIRRLKGRVVATALAKTLVQPRRGTLSTLAGLIGGSARTRYGMPLPRRDAEGALALLAVADGTVRHLDELSSRVAEGAAVLDATDSIFASDRFDRILAARIAPDAGSKDDELVRLIEGLACLSAPKQFGVVTPSMREVARWALI